MGVPPDTTLSEGLCEGVPPDNLLSGGTLHRDLENFAAKKFF